MIESAHKYKANQRNGKKMCVYDKIDDMLPRYIRINHIFFSFEKAVISQWHFDCLVKFRSLPKCMIIIILSDGIQNICRFVQIIILLSSNLP